MDSGRTFARARAVLGLLAILLEGTEGRADDRGSITTPRYVDPQPSPHYVRAAAETFGILVVGSIQYASQSSNSTDWDLDYDWPSFRKKLTGEALRFDTNHFDTNMITHPTAGTFYYVAARGNRLTLLESLLYTTAASTLWEYVGEFREMASVNDLIVTPLAGAAFGETLTQLGIYVRRGRPSPVREVVATLLAPSTVIHDRIDGAAPWRSSEADGWGLSREPGHAFEISSEGGARWARGARTEATTRFALHAEVIDVERFHTAGDVSGWMTDGGVTRLDAEASLAQGGLRDVQLDAVVTPAAYYQQHLRREGGDLAGYRLLVGTDLGFDYGLHRYAAAPPGEIDRVSGVHAAGVWVHAEALSGAVRVHADLDVHPEFAAVHSLGRAGYLTRGGDPASLPTVTRDEGYYYALGAVASPSVEIGVGRFTLGAKARFETYGGVQGVDRRQEDIHDEVDLHDTRVLGRAWMAFAPLDALALRLVVERRLRQGHAGSVGTSFDESAAFAGLGVTF